MEILMDEDEMCESDYSDEALRQIILLDGPKVRDKLLIPKEPDG